MKRAHWSSLRFRLVLLVMLGGIPSFVLFFYTAADQRQVATAEVKVNALRLARVASMGQERVVEGARQVLLLLSRLPEVRGHDAVRCSELLGDLMGHYPLYANIGVIELDGRVFASGLHLAGMEQLNLADRTYFQRALASGGFAMGDYQIGRITGKATVNFAHPVRHEQGELVRVVYAALDLDWLETLAEEIALPEGSTLLVADHQGTVLMHYPDSHSWRGKSLLEIAGLSSIVSEREGAVRAEGLDGHTRLYAFTPLGGAEGSGFVSVGVGIPESLAYAEADRMLRRNIGLLILLAIAVLVAAWVGSNSFVLRQVRSLLAVIARVQQGDLTARTGVSQGSGELMQVARAFDGMAESLEQRIREREQAEQALRRLNEELEQRVAERTRELDEKNQMMEGDLALAHDFQTALLPQSRVEYPFEADPGKSRLRFYHRYEPSSGVGGDFFEILELTDRKAGLFVCDVMGHGIRAALVTAIIRGLAQELRAKARDPGKFVTEMHRALFDIFDQAQSGMFAAGLYLVVDIDSGEARCANAGNPRPLLVRRSQGKVEELQFAEAGAGPALGLIGEAVYGSVALRLEPGDAVIVFTDGLYEVPCRDGEDFGEERLREAVASRIGLPTEALINGLLDEVRSVAENGKFLDDVCIVGMEIAAPGP